MLGEVIDERMAKDADVAGLGRMALAAPTALEELGPLVLGNHPLDLNSWLV
jgi:hypothetical protein